MSTLPAPLLAVLIVHIVSGFVGMYSGLVPFFARKGGKAHRKWGMIFTYAMGIAAVSAFPLAAWRSDPLQAQIGLLSGYLTWFGYRVLRRQDAATLSRQRVLDWGAAILGIAAFLAATGAGAYLLWARPTAQARVMVLFGIIGLLIVGRDLQGLTTGSTSFARRIQDHLIASSLAVMVAFSAFLNTQFHRITQLSWPLDAKMLLPAAVALPLLAFWLPIWNRRLQTQASTGDILRASGHEVSEAQWMRRFGIAEGVSFLVLLGIAMPLKRLAGHPEFVAVMGQVHGALFILYVVSVLLAARALRLKFPTVMLALAAAVVPFGTFVFDALWQRGRVAARAG